jgi:hypothetical protein
VRDPGNVPLDHVEVRVTLAPVGVGADRVPTRAAVVRLGTIESTGSRFVNVPAFAVSPSLSSYVLTVVVTADGVPTVSRSFHLRIAAA